MAETKLETSLAQFDSSAKMLAPAMGDSIASCRSNSCPKNLTDRKSAINHKTKFFNRRSPRDSGIAAIRDFAESTSLLTTKVSSCRARSRRIT